MGGHVGEKERERDTEVNKIKLKTELCGVESFDRRIDRFNFQSHSSDEQIAWNNM